MMAAKQRHEFRVAVSDLELSDKQQEQVCGALQQALLQSMAALDFGGDRVAVALPLRDGGGGGTQGIQARAVRREDLEQLLDRDM